MKKFGLIVIGGGSGLKVSSKAAEHGLKVAVIEKGPLGGTCLNRGCIPSKILLHTADIAETINGSGKFGINSKITKIRFSEIIKRASNIVDKEAKEIEQAIISDKNTTLYKTGAKFIGNKLVKVGNETITAKKIVIAAGTRPFAPPIPGLKEAGYITSDEALRLKKQPKTMTIIGGGYIGCELAHFFGSLGTKVTILEFIDGLLANEDSEISKKFTEIFSKKHSVCTGYKASKVEKSNVKYVVYAERDGKIKKIVSDELLVAVGRIPNTDTLNATASGIKTSKRGYIEVNDFMETNVKGIWALGDIAGKWFFKHSANLEAECVYNNIFSKKKRVNYEAMPHAIFTSPQIAGVGMREQDLQEKKIPCSKGYCNYKSTGMGQALQEKDGFVKILADKKGKILGCHIIGPDASALIQEVVVAMKAGSGTVQDIINSVHPHPALTEAVQRAALNVE